MRSEDPAVARRRALISICMLLGCVFVHGRAFALEPVKYPTGVAYRGINRAGLEYGDYWMQNVDGWDGTQEYFAQPTKKQIQAELDYFKSEGMNVLRLPFSWERLQHTLNGPLTDSYVAFIVNYVEEAENRGMSILLDLHTYARYATNAFAANGKQNTTPGSWQQHVLGDGTLQYTQLADVWTRLIKVKKLQGKSNLIFGLMNEPHHLPKPSGWFAGMQTVINAIRGTGATQLILVPNPWGWQITNWDWNTNPVDNWDTVPNTDATTDPMTQPNSLAALTITDSNFAFDVHQYDSISASADSYKQRFQKITDWARANGKRLFITEFGVPSYDRLEEPHTEIDGNAIRGLLDFFDQNSSVWLGWTPWNLKEYLITPLGKYTEPGPSMPWYRHNLDPAVFTPAAPGGNTTSLFTLKLDGSTISDQTGRHQIEVGPTATSVHACTGKDKTDPDGNAALCFDDGYLTVTNARPETAADFQLAADENVRLSFWFKSSGNGTRLDGTAFPERMYAIGFGGEYANIDVDFGDPDTIIMGGPSTACWTYWNGIGALQIVDSVNTDPLFYYDANKPGAPNQGWHHYVLERRGQTISVTMDNRLLGSAQESAAIGSADPGNPNWIGRESVLTGKVSAPVGPWPAAAFPWRGAISGVRLEALAP